MHGLKHWKGLEVEGAYSDIKTIFIRSEIPEEIDDYPHIYFTFEYVEGLISGKYKWSDIIEILDNTNQIITMEANEKTLRLIPKRVYNHIHIIYRIQVPTCDIDYLKRCDNISLDNGMYNTYITQKQQMQHVDADNYKHDII